MKSIVILFYKAVSFTNLKIKCNVVQRKKKNRQLFMGMKFNSKRMTGHIHIYEN